jgi:hypothetical protein
VDFWELFCHGLLQNPQGDSHGLKVLSTSGDVNIDGAQAGVVDDGVLYGLSGTSMKGMRR